MKTKCGGAIPGRIFSNELISLNAKSIVGEEIKRDSRIFVTKFPQYVIVTSENSVKTSGGKKRFFYKTSTTK